MGTPRRAPAGFGPAGKALWSSVVDEFELEIGDAQTLEAACHTADEIRAMEAELAEADVLVEGSAGQVAVHPLVRELRSHRLALSKLIDAVSLPSERDGLERSSAARTMAHARWRHGTA